ncbi:MAG: membrane protein [bacterium P3]|nr:MAG: membrane protein [bacterium P3]KWW40087.1 MAG: membrane protein [bacterium F083]
MADAALNTVDRPSGLQRRLFTGVFWLLLLNLLVKPFWILGVEVGVQNAVGSEAYGLYFAVFNLSYIFNIVLDLGITNFNTRNIARHPVLINKHLSGILGVKILLLALYAVITFGAGLMLGYDSYQFRLLAWLSLNQFLSSLILYLRSNFEGLLLFRWDSLLSVLDRLLMILICGLLLWGPAHISGGRFTIFHFVYAQTAAYLATALTALAVLSRKTSFRRLRFNRLFTLAVLKQSLPFALLVLLMASYNRLDPVLLQRLSRGGAGNFNAGIYAGAFRLLDALTMVAYLVSVVLLPVFSKMTDPLSVSSRGLQPLSSTVKTMTSLMLVFSVTAACTLSSAGAGLMALFYNDHIADHAAVFRILIFCLIPVSCTYLFGTLLTAAGQLRLLNRYAAASLLLNLLVNLLCIPRWGAVGSAWAALSAQTFMAVAQIIASLRIFSLRPSRAYISKLFYFTFIIIACTCCAPHFVWWINIPVVAAVALVLAFVLKLVDTREIIRIIQQH